jgi:hypothetical protein
VLAVECTATTVTVQLSDIAVASRDANPGRAREAARPPWPRDSIMAVSIPTHFPFGSARDLMEVPSATAGPAPD